MGFLDTVIKESGNEYASIVSDGVAAGDTYISPFVGRMNDNSLSGVELVRAISGLYCAHGVRTKILAASLRDVHHVSRCLMYGASVVTLPPAVFDKMYNHVLTDSGLAIFEKDFKEING